VHAPETKTLEVLQSSGMLTLNQLAWLKEQVRDGKSMVLCGPTGVGKTTLLRALLQDSNERIICIEQTPELCLPAPAISLTERQANQEGAGQIELDELIVDAA
jgi:pilus assembly protein CpaF